MIRYIEGYKLPSYYFYWFRIDIKHMTEPWLDQAPMESAYRSVGPSNEYQVCLKWKYIVWKMHFRQELIGMHT